MAATAFDVSREQLVSGARLLWSLPALLRHPIKPGEARALLRKRLARREDDFLDLVHRAVFQNASNPYRQLLQHAGYEPGDLDRLMRQEGVEGALRRPYELGVYLTVDELKGRRPAGRGSSSITVNPVLIRNPSARLYPTAHTGGSRGTHTPVPLDYRFIRDQAQVYCLRLEAAGGLGWSSADWYAPGNAAAWALRFTLAGGRLVRRFAQAG